MENLFVDAIAILTNLAKQSNLEDSIVYLTRYLESVVEQALALAHYCPGCGTIWPCDFPECNTSVEMLCATCDDEDVRARLGGKWLG
jgi:hypothetical protein